MILPLISARITEQFVTLCSEAEEKTNSAEEQLANNRFLHHTEIVVWVFSFVAVYCFPK